MTFCTLACRPNVNYIKRVQSLEEGVGNPQTEAEIEEAIQKYQRRVEDIMAADNQIGIWYKILGVRYLDNRMYGKALDAFKSAAQYHPDNQNLYYYIGVCAGYMAKSELDFSSAVSAKQRNSYLLLAESAYMRALELEPRYVRSLYGLAVLYVFEMNMSEKAVPLLERLLAIDTKHIDAMFLLARAYYMTYNYQAAADMYDRIMLNTKNNAKLADAQANKKTALDALYSGKQQ
ncbi:tetratricopeptide repeat protein [Treponema sp. OMZ 840]